MLTTTIERAAPVAQEQQHHQPGQHRAERAFQREPRDRARDVGRLVELVADLHVVGQHALELRQVLPSPDRRPTSVEASARLVTGM